MVCNGDDLTDALVTANQRSYRLHRPVPLADMKICVTHPCADHLDETLARLELRWLYDGDVALYHHGLLGAGENGGDLSLWDLIGHCVKSRKNESRPRGSYLVLV